MPRYYFDMHEDDLVNADPVGSDLPEHEAARAEAVLALAQWAKDVLPTRRVRSLSIRVRDETKKLILVAELLFKVTRVR
jgi:hypothetical protein